MISLDLGQLVQELCEQDIAHFFAQVAPREKLEDRLHTVMAFFLENFKLYQQQLLLWVDFYQHSQQKAIEDQQFLRGVWQRTHNQLLVFMDGLLLQCLYSRGFDELSWRENLESTLD